MKGYNKFHRKFASVFVILFGISRYAVLPVWAEDAAAKDTAVIQKTEEGLHFNVPADWPIEKRGGIMAPIPIEEYLARKFKALEQQIQAMEQRGNSLDVRLRVVEEELKKQRLRLQLDEHDDRLP